MRECHPGGCRLAPDRPVRAVVGALGATAQGERAEAAAGRERLHSMSDRPGILGIGGMAKAYHAADLWTAIGAK